MQDGNGLQLGKNFLVGQERGGSPENDGMGRGKERRERAGVL